MDRRKLEGAVDKSSDVFINPTYCRTPTLGLTGDWHVGRRNAGKMQLIDFYLFGKGAALFQQI